MIILMLLEWAASGTGQCGILFTVGLESHFHELGNSPASLILYDSHLAYLFNF